MCRKVWRFESSPGHHGLYRFPEFVAQHNQVPWRSMRGMRNRIAHGYFDINLDLVWNTVQTALPDLIEDISRLRQEPS